MAGPSPALAVNHGPVPLPTTGCRWSKAPKPVLPVLTTVEVTVDLHQSVIFGGGSGPVTNYSCVWDGKKLPKPANPESPQYSVQLFLQLYYSSSSSAAIKLYTQISTGLGTPTPVSGVGNRAAFLPGQDIVTEQLVVRAGAYVFIDQLSSSEAHALQKAQLTTVAHQVVARLAA